MLQSQMLRLPYDASYLRRTSENWRHRRGLWQKLVAVTYRTGPVRCPLPIYVDYSALPAQPPYGRRTMLCLFHLNRRLYGDRTIPSDISCKDNPAATARSPYGGRTMLFVAERSYDVFEKL